MPRFVPGSYDLVSKVCSGYLGVGCQGLFWVMMCWVPRFVQGAIALGAKFVPGTYNLSA